jgi:hypothetical protein
MLKIYWMYDEITECLSSPTVSTSTSQGTYPHEEYYSKSEDGTNSTKFKQEEDAEGLVDSFLANHH